GQAQLAQMEERKNQPHIKTPDQVTDNLQKDAALAGESIYYKYCGICHQSNGKGARGRWPALTDPQWIAGDKASLISIVLNGLEGEIEVNGIAYNEVMPQHSFLSDIEIAEVLSYVRQSFGNDAPAITAEEVRKVREGSATNYEKPTP
ncbi:MAG: cytochrome c, partial [Bacteroidota bacterium]